jgi:menaquinone-specific isochorismate synthase
MPVTPYRVNLSQDRQFVQDLLRNGQGVSLDQRAPQLVSLALEIPPVDPLQVLQRWQQPSQPLFYWEHRSEQLAIAATQPERWLQVNTPARFDQVQSFWAETLLHSMVIGNQDLPFAGPHLFCGFTFFDQSSQEQPPFPSASAFLPRWQITRCQNQGVLGVNLAIDGNSDLALLTDLIVQRWQQLQDWPLEFPDWSLDQPIEFRQSATSTATLAQSIQQTLHLIETDQLQKLVLAHSLEITTQSPLDLGHTLHRLRTYYPDCYVFAMCNDRGQTFLGASPERLVQLRDRQLITDVLAGSAPRGETVVEDISFGKNLLHNQKDGHEHQLVLEFICQQLKHLGMTPQVSLPAHVLQLPNIQHLRTVVTAEVPNSIQLLDILATLHPTPAVAGTPRDLAVDYIRRYEAFERYLYAGPLGWLDHQGNGEFAVGIRSALTDGCRTRLYAGAGIVAGSDLAKELAEVELKLQTLLDALT